MVGLDDVGVHDAFRAGAVEERDGPLPGQVEEVVEAEQVARAQVGVDRPGDVDGDDVPDAEVGERADVGAVVDEVRRHRVARAVAGEEDDRDAVHVPRVTRASPNVVDGLLAGVLQRVQVVETGAGDDAERRARHAPHATGRGNGRGGLGAGARPRWQDARMERRLAIAATGPVSLAAGREVARRGNAVDVAVAAAMAAMSTEPGIASLAGGAFVSVWPADGEPVVIDGNVEMPGRGLPVERFGAGVEEVFTEYAGGVTLYTRLGRDVRRRHRLRAGRREPSGCGPLSSSRRDGCAWTATRSGRPPRATCPSPPTFFGRDLEALRVVTREDGTPLEPGDLATNPALADVLGLVGREGSSVLTTARSAARWPTTWPGTVGS